MDSLLLVSWHSQHETALEQLKEIYGRSSIIYPKYIEELVSCHRYDYSQDSMTHIIRRVEYTLDCMDKISGKIIEQLATALVVRDFDEELSKEWARHLGSLDKIPDTKQLLDFIRPLSHNLPAKTKPANHHHHATKTTIQKEYSSSNSSFKKAAAFSRSLTNNSKNCAAPTILSHIAKCSWTRISTRGGL